MSSGSPGGPQRGNTAMRAFLRPHADRRPILKGQYGMSPITSFTASLGHNGLIDVFAVSNSQVIDSTVWRARQKTPDGEWSAWVNEGKPGKGAGWVQSVLDTEKHGHVLALTDAAQLWFKERTPTDSLSAWKPLGGPPVKRAEIADPVPNDAWLFLRVWAGVHADGRIDLAGTANDIGDSRDVFYRARPASSTAWTAWSPLGDNGFDGALVAAIARDGGLEVITPVDVFPGQGEEEIGMQHKRRHPDGTWTSWSRLGRPAGGFSEYATPVLIPGPGGVLELFAVAAAGTVWHNSQPAGGSWSGWAPLADAGAAATDIVVAASADGGLDLCAVLRDNTVAHCRQDDHGGPWTGWTSLGAPDADAIANPALVLDSESCLNLFLARPQDEGLIVLRQKTQNGPFTTGTAVPALRPS
jgi:hypothetical protein